ncbi:MAG TPA: hypothetical protein VGD94_04555 [Vicinamibacterales bacterium]
MEIDAVPAALRQRLGPDATVDLVELFDRFHSETKESMIAACTERFERRLVEEVAGVRFQLAKTESGLRQELTKLGAELRQEMTQLGAELRQDMTQLGADLRQENAQAMAGLRQEIATGRVELFKWCFLFWIGQVLAIGGMMAVMLRLIR